LIRKLNFLENLIQRISTQRASFTYQTLKTEPIFSEYTSEGFEQGLSISASSFYDDLEAYEYSVEYSN